MQLPAPVRYLVTGGAGFIGSAFVRMLLADPGPGVEVTVLRVVATIAGR